MSESDYTVLPPAPPVEENEINIYDSSILTRQLPNGIIENEYIVLTQSVKNDPELEPKITEFSDKKTEESQTELLNQILVEQGFIEPEEKTLQNFKKGEFLYINNCSHTREMLSIGWKAINILELWDYMKKETPSYMWSNDKEVNLIANKIIELGYDGHSGFSFGWTMRQLQYIAINGEEKYMDNFK
jgi:hypothetical protein